MHRLAHGRGIIRRDLKPENILLSGGHALVPDFGVAKAVAGDQPPDRPLTQVGIVVGTPYYMSPEPGTGSRGGRFRPGPRADSSGRGGIGHA
jgi:serine/threonine-protein kinase